MHHRGDVRGWNDHSAEVMVGCSMLNSLVASYRVCFAKSFKIA